MRPHGTISSVDIPSGYGPERRLQLSKLLVVTHIGSELGLNDSRYWIYRIAKNLVIDYYRRRYTQNRTQERIKENAVVNSARSRSAEEIFETKDRILDIE